MRHASWIDQNPSIKWKLRGYSQPVAEDVTAIHFSVLVSVMPGEHERRIE
jgi:hypothetical protein